MKNLFLWWSQFTVIDCPKLRHSECITKVKIHTTGKTINLILLHSVIWAGVKKSLWAKNAFRNTNYDGLVCKKQSKSEQYLVLKPFSFKQASVLIGTLAHS